MRAQQQKKGKKKADSGEENEHDDADDIESNNEEEEYNSADDSETETDSEEVQQERRAKRRQEESVITAKPVHDSTVAETCPESGPQPQPGPEPAPQPQPQPQPEAAILFGAEPQEVIDGFVAACQEVEETEAAIKACEEAELRYQQVITAYSLVLNNEPIPRFQSDVYILPPSALEKKTFFVVDSRPKDAPAAIEQGLISSL
ncbi:hypothetical protein PIB30_106742, partial [Stylosanthes scabra]|nr:hypothetical protein [Stylosanthes scabra]